MEEESAEKNVEAGHDNRKNKGDSVSGNSSPSHSSNNISLSLSPTLLPDNQDVGSNSGGSSISEHISTAPSIENDRSFSEIDISHNFPENLSQILLNQTDDVTNISQERIPSLNSSSKTDNTSTTTLPSASKNVKSILDEILHNDQFKSEKSDSFSCHSNEASLNIFEGVNLDDSSINNYVLRLKSTNFDMTDKNSLNESNYYAGNFVDTPKSLEKDDKSDNDLKIRSLEDILNAKDSTINALNMEVDSLREMTSNQSTFSLNTTTTEYKQCQEEFANKIEEYETAMTQRENLIHKLKESLQQSVDKRNDLEQESEHFAKEIIALQTELADATEFIKKCHCKSKYPLLEEEAPYDSLENSEKHPSENSENPSVAQTKPVLNLDTICSNMELTLNPAQAHLFVDLKTQINGFIKRNITDNKVIQENEIKSLKNELENEKTQHDIELGRLRELLGSVKCGSTEIMELRQELEAKHIREMEELRKYYEKKCADVEKNFSEEIFSQQSRKMSGSSTGSDPELASDLIFSPRHPQPGPGGDTAAPPSFTKFDYKPNIMQLQKHDLILLKQVLDDATNTINKYDLESTTDLSPIKTELSRFDFIALLKIDLIKVRNELRDDFVAKLESLKAENEVRVQFLNEEHECRVGVLEEQLDKLKYDLDEARENIGNAIQEVTSSSDGIDAMVMLQSYELRLHNQIALNRIELFDELQNQVQILASSTDVAYNEWPPEFLQIRNRFTEKYEADIGDLNAQHVEEISKLKQDHLRALNGALKRRNSREVVEVMEDLETIKERDESISKSSTLVRNLFAELQNYFVQCEAEVNNTLVDEFVKQGTENETMLNETLNSTSNSLIGASKHIHFTPNISEIIDSLGTSSLDVTSDLKTELDACLERLKSDANALLLATVNFKRSESSDERAKSLEDHVNSLTRRLISDSQIKTDLSEQLDEAREFVRSLERERVSLDTQVEQLVAKNNILEDDLCKASQKIADLIECGHKEIISEGYGEDTKMGLHVGQMATLGELQERARILAIDCSSSDNPLLQLVEDLCKEGDRITEESKRDQDDLRLQIEAADKKIRANSNFLEEQAVEREQERDDAQKEIVALRDQLREREKDKISCERINTEVEQLEQQMRDMSRLMDESDQKLKEIEKERKEAIDKIYVLRDIIRDLESQIASKTETEIECKDVISKLEEVIRQQRETTDDLQTQLEAGSRSSELRDHLLQLEEENQRLRLTNELVGNEGALRQIQIQLYEIEVTIDKRTRDLEILHAAISTTSCSSPSEDMSVRDQVRPRTPNSTLDECDVPLQQLARLKEKLVKHSRAEDAAIKRIRDLEMQLITSKHEHDELQNERDLLQDQIHEQLTLISSLQMRLDDQRLRAEHIQKQTNTSLEARIYDLETEVQNLCDQLHNKDKSIKQLRKDVEQTKQSLSDREKELSSALDDHLVISLQREVDDLRSDNLLLKTKIESDAQNVQILPNLVDNIICDKNNDIEKLRRKLSDTQKNLEMYLSLNLDEEQLKNLSQMSNTNRHLSGILSLVDFGDTELRKSVGRSESFEGSNKIQYLRKNNETTSLDFEPEISSIERIGPANINFTVDAPLVKPNSTEIHRSSERRVHFEDSVDTFHLQSEIIAKNLLIKDLETQLEHLKDLENRISELETALENADTKLKEASANFDEEHTKMSGLEKELRVELAEAKMHLRSKENDLEDLKQDGLRKDEMYLNLAKEKRDMDKEYNDFEGLIRSKSSQIEDLQRELLELQNGLKEARGLVAEKHEFNLKLGKELEISATQLNVQLDEVKKLQESFVNEEKKSKQFQALLEDRECELEILNEDINRYQNDIQCLENKLKSGKNLDDSETQLKLMKNRKELAEKQLEIVKLKTIVEDLNKEIIHLQDYLSEKDKIIEQTRLDSKSLQVNLETIQEKMKENGNIVDLSNKLLQEQQMNAILQSEINDLKIMDRNNEMIASMEEITGQVRRQLDVSAHLDTNIINALNSGNFSTINDLEVLKQIISKERNNSAEMEAQLKNLEEKYDLAIEKIRELQTILENERQATQMIEIEDANLLEQMRINLNAALDNEKELNQILDTEKKRFIALENQLVILKQKPNSDSSSNSKTELTEYKSLPTIESQEILQLRAELGGVIEDNGRLKKDLRALKKAKSEADAGVKYSKDVLNLKCKQVEKLEKNIEKMREDDMAAKDRFVVVKVELDQRKREVENSRILLGELEQEKLEMETKVTRLNDRISELMEEKNLHRTAAGDRDADLSSPLPERFLRKMKDLGELVTDHIKENKLISETLSKLTEERTHLQERIKELEDQNLLHMPFDDPAARANHLFGKYLRADSYRKALIWQKCFLIRLLASYQNLRPLEQRISINTFEPRNRVAVKSRGVKRFRIVSFGIIATIRMNFLVQRWHCGKRHGAYTSLRHKYTNIYNTATAHPPHHSTINTTSFQVGQPVSSKNFLLSSSTTHQLHRPPRPRDSNGTPDVNTRGSTYDIPRASTPPEQQGLPPWSGFTPPSKEKLRTSFNSRNNTIPSTSEQLAPLKAPEILSQYIERFDLIQHRLGMTLESHSNT